MSSLVYPNRGNSALAPPCAFFSPIPRAVGALCAEGRLKPRDVQVLTALLDYKSLHTTEVRPLQATLARRLGCALDTLQRSLKRLTEAGLIVKTRLRDAKGRLCRCVYDLANTLALLPRQAAKMRSGHWGEMRLARPAPRPQNCGFSEADSAVVQADSPSSPPARPPVVAALDALGVRSAMSRALVARFGEDRCRQALQALRAQKQVRSQPAWLVGCLLQGWNITAMPSSPSGASLFPKEPTPPKTATLPKREGEEFPLRGFASYSSPFPLRESGAVAPGTAIPRAGLGSDPLTALTPAAYAALEEQARALLWTETKPAFRDLLLARTSRASQGYVRGKMRALLANVRAASEGRHGRCLP